MHVKILGCGPAGLLAALAAEQKGYHAVIYSLKTPSVVGGAQYLHTPIPGLTDGQAPSMITYVKVGDVDGYAHKAYGEPGAQVSWDTFITGEYPSWNLRGLYERLWDRFKDDIIDRAIAAHDIDELCMHDPDTLVFSSIPLKSICKDPIAHEFAGQEVVFTEEPYVKVPMLQIYNGRSTDAWYRAACLFDYSSTEYALGNGFDDQIPMDKVMYRGIKPVKNSCNCFTHHANFRRIGRFGQWRRGILTNHAYEEVKAAL